MLTTLVFLREKQTAGNAFSGVKNPGNSKNNPVKNNFSCSD